jgi:hypothetical protein
MTMAVSEGVGLNKLQFTTNISMSAGLMPVFLKTSSINKNK